MPPGMASLKPEECDLATCFLPTLKAPASDQDWDCGFHPAFFLVTFAPILSSFLTVPVGRLFI